jgi:hypothetical protein
MAIAKRPAHSNVARGVPRVRNVRVTLATETTTFREAVAAPRYGDVVMHRDVAVHSNVHDMKITPQTRYSTKQIKTDGSRARRRYAFTCAPSIAAA